jgi:DNA-binding XRE family transcriptional regulator
MLVFINIFCCVGGDEMRNLKRLREKREFSQESLGAIVGVSRFSILDYENGRKSPTYIVAKKIAEALDCSLEDLDSNPIAPAPE